MKNLQSVLLIEDDETVNFYNEFLIKEMGYANEIVIAQNGKEGIEYLRQLNEQGKAMPQLIFLDINMPVMNGFEFLEAFEGEGLTGSTLIVMLTTSLHPADIERAKKHKSITDYVYKPLMKDHLETIIKSHFELN